VVIPVLMGKECDASLQASRWAQWCQRKLGMVEIKFSFSCPPPPPYPTRLSLGVFQELLITFFASALEGKAKRSGLVGEAVGGGGLWVGERVWGCGCGPCSPKKGPPTTPGPLQSIDGVSISLCLLQYYSDLIDKMGFPISTGRRRWHHRMGCNPSSTQRRNWRGKGDDPELPTRKSG
jgi:hypothetical protein